MSCSRRDFMAGMGAGALIMMTGTASANTRSLATTLAH
ncbi:MAG: cytochrome c nitrite reductase Fe-S protein, partial [Aeromonas veronii]